MENDDWRKWDDNPERPVLARYLDSIFDDIRCELECIRMWKKISLDKQETVGAVESAKAEIQYHTGRKEALLDTFSYIAGYRLYESTVEDIGRLRKEMGKPCFYPWQHSAYFAIEKLKNNI